MKKKSYFRYILFLVLCILFYIVFRHSLSEIIKEVLDTSGTVLVAISIASIVYHLMEGRITYLLAKRHTNSYTYIKAIKNSFYASFYRVITFGSGGGVSAIYNLHLDHIPVSEGIGLYFVGYVIHKIAIFLYGLIILLTRYGWVQKNYASYNSYLLIGYALGVIVIIGMVLVCVSPIIYKIIHYFFQKLIGHFPKYQEKLDDLDMKIQAMQKETKSLLADRLLLIRILFDNFIKLSCYYIIPYLILYHTGQLSAVDSISLIAITYILSAAIPTPSGVGSIEAVYLLLIANFINSVEAVASMLLFRFATMIVPCIIGGLYIVFRNMFESRLAIKS